MLRSSPGWKEFMRKKRGSLMVAPRGERPPTRRRPNGWPGMNDNDAGTFAWLKRFTSVVERLNPNRATFNTLVEKTRVATKLTYWLRCDSSSANKPKTWSVASCRSFALSSIVYRTKNEFFSFGFQSILAVP